LARWLRNAVISAAPHVRKFETGDACNLQLADRSFDRVFALLVLHFVPRTEQGISETLRVARPGAVVAAAVWDARGGFVANRIFF